MEFKLKNGQSVEPTQIPIGVSLKQATALKLKGPVETMRKLSMKNEFIFQEMSFGDKIPHFLTKIKKKHTCSILV